MNFVEHIINEGDTIQSIAQKYTGDVTNWRSIAQFNDLRYPYIVDTLKEKKKNPEHLLTVSDYILIRQSEDEKSTLITSLRNSRQYTKEDIYATALGKDLYVIDPHSDFTDHGELELSYDRGDVAITKGVDNLKQALFIRLITAKGSYLGHPEFGSEVHRYIGNKNTEENASDLDLEIERTLRSDGRVSSVSIEGHEVNGNTYTSYFQVSTLSDTEAFMMVIGARSNGEIYLVQ